MIPNTVSSFKYTTWIYITTYLSLHTYHCNFLSTTEIGVSEKLLWIPNKCIQKTNTSYWNCQRPERVLCIFLGEFSIAVIYWVNSLKPITKWIGMSNHLSVNIFCFISFFITRQICFISSRNTIFIIYHYDGIFWSFIGWYQTLILRTAVSHF